MEKNYEYRQCDGGVTVSIWNYCSSMSTSVLRRSNHYDHIMYFIVIIVLECSLLLHLSVKSFDINFLFVALLLAPARLHTRTRADNTMQFHCFHLLSSLAFYLHFWIPVVARSLIRWGRLNYPWILETEFSRQSSSDPIPFHLILCSSFQACSEPRRLSQSSLDTWSPRRLESACFVHMTSSQDCTVTTVGVMTDRTIINL